jgi:hypothetical protein
VTPAEEIATAAAKLRALAETATPGNWWAEELPPNEHHKHPAHWVKTEYDDGPNLISSQVVADCPWRQADAAYIAAMGPAVGFALAAWLHSWTGIELREDAALPEDAQHVLATARAINGAQP